MCNIYLEKMNDIVDYMSEYYKGIELENIEEMKIFKVVYKDKHYLVPYSVLKTPNNNNGISSTEIINRIAVNLKMY